MKKFCIFLLTIFSTTLFGQNTFHQLIPKPVDVEQFSGVFVVAPSMQVSFNSNESENCAHQLAKKLNVATGFAISIVEGSKGNIQLNILEKYNPILGNEGYKLSITPTLIVISANKSAGLFYGVQTLLQLLPLEIESKMVVHNKLWQIPAGNITDYPRFAWRGLMLDVSRHFFSKDEVKAFIDQMAQFKYNTLHLHLTDDNGWRIEIKSLPRLTDVGAWRVPRAGRFGERDNPKPSEIATYGGFYSQNDIREIVQYATNKFITIVPEIDIPGHSMAAIAAYPQLSCTKDTSIKVNPGTAFGHWYENGTFKMNVDNTLNPSDERVYEFLDKVFTEVAQLFPGKYIHVGGDECYKGYWKQNGDCKSFMKKQNIRHIEDLQGYFMQRVEKILTSRGKTMIGWDEIIEGGVSPSATIMNWRSPEIGAEASKAGHSVVMTPTAYSYLDYCQGELSIEPTVYSSLSLSTCYSFEPVPIGANANNILGGQGNLWTENIPNFRQIQYMLFPRAWALSEVFWSQKESKNWTSFIQRVEKQFERSDAAQSNYSKAIYDAIVEISLRNGSMWLQISTEALGLDIYYTIDDSMPDNYSLKYSNAIALPNGPITLRVVTYRNGKPIGHLITLNPDDLKTRIK